MYSLKRNPPELVLGDTIQGNIQTGYIAAKIQNFQITQHFILSELDFYLSNSYKRRKPRVKYPAPNARALIDFLDAKIQKQPVGGIRKE